MTDGVTVALQFLELSVQVRILVGQRKKRLPGSLTGASFFFVNKPIGFNQGGPLIVNFPISLLFSIIAATNNHGFAFYPVTLSPAFIYNDY